MVLNCREKNVLCCDNYYNHCFQHSQRYRRVELCDCVDWNHFRDGWPNIFINNVESIAGRDGEAAESTLWRLNSVSFIYINTYRTARCYAPLFCFCDLLPGKRGGGVTTRTCAFASLLSPPPSLPRIRVLCSVVEDENSLRSTCRGSTEGWKSCWPRTCCKLT